MAEGRKRRAYRTGACKLAAPRTALCCQQEIVNVTLDVAQSISAQILLNLTNNALKYTDAGSVVISIARSEVPHDSHCLISVQDTGIGIKPEDRRRLFQAFEQLEPLSTRRVEGVGLGLHLSQKLALLIGAQLSFTSEPGVGSTFVLALPANGAT